MNVDNVSTKCDKLLNTYKIRHDEVLKCIHMALIRKYEFSDNLKIKNLGSQIHITHD